MAEAPKAAEASRIAARADELVRLGQDTQAWELYEKAATLTREALDAAPADAVKTRALLSVNVCALLYKAHRYEQAEEEAIGFMKADLSPSRPVRAKLLEIMVSAQQASSVKTREESALSTVELDMKGGRVGWGLVPIEELTRRLVTFRDLVWRCAEQLEGLMFRVKGPPPAGIRNSADILAGMTAPGSYRVQMKIVARPVQLMLEQPTRYLTGYGEQLIHHVLEVTRAVAQGDEAAQQVLVPDFRYRLAMMKAIRDLAPDGAKVGTIEIAGGIATWRRTSMTQETRQAVRDSIVRMLAAEGFEQVTGTLTGLVLEKRRLIATVTSQQGDSVSVEAPRDEGWEERLGPQWRQTVAVSYRVAPQGGLKASRRILVEIDQAGEESD